MEAKAYLRHARISPRKVQIVLDLIRNKPVEEAAAILALTPKAACEPLANCAFYPFHKTYKAQNAKRSY